MITYNQSRINKMLRVTHATRFIISLIPGIRSALQLHTYQVAVMAYSHPPHSHRIVLDSYRLRTLPLNSTLARGSAGLCKGSLSRASKKNDRKNDRGPGNPLFQNGVD